MSKREDKKEEYITYVIIAVISSLMIASLIALVTCSFSLFICKKDLGISLFNLSTCFVGTSASLLVYIAFREQVKTNKETFRRIEKQEKETQIEKKKNEEHNTFDRINLLIIDLKPLLENFTYTKKQPFGGNDFIDKPINDIDAFIEFEHALSENLSNLRKIKGIVTALVSLKNILINLNFITSEIVSFNPNDRNMKMIIQMKFQNVFHKYSNCFKNLEHDFETASPNKGDTFFFHVADCLQLILTINESYKEIKIQR